MPKSTPARRHQRIEKHLELDKRTGVLDVHVLDVLAQVEALLRDAREIQRQILRVRGVPRPPTAKQRRMAATVVRRTARQMLEDSRGLSTVWRELQREAETLKAAADAPSVLIGKRERTSTIAHGPRS